jgi:electron-transferring-flavoprotein dehydrogenase
MSGSPPAGMEPPAEPRQTLEADIVCVGFGPAVGGFLTTLSRGMFRDDGTPVFESAASPGLPLQVIGYERADDIAFGVSGVATRARAFRRSFPDFDPASLPLTTPIERESLVYLLDPCGASRRSPALRLVDALVRAGRWALPFERDALVLPYIPPFLRKDGGLVLSIGQLNQWVGQQLLASGAIQIWPGTPVAAPLVEGEAVAGVRLVDQGTDLHGRPSQGYLPGMDVRAALTVVGDGPVGAVGRALDERFGLPPGHRRDDWAVGMKAVVDLREGTDLAPGTVIHTLGFPEPEIFGFLYVCADRVASLGIFVPSWFRSPTRTAYRYLQHWMLHPYLWRHLEGGTLRSWGAKTLGESGKRGEPYLAGDGYARIGEGSGSTNVLTGSGVDEAWATGVQLAEGVLELLAAGEPFTRENLERAYVARRRSSWVETGVRVAERSRDGFQRGVVSGLLGMAVAGLTGGRVSLFGPPRGRRSPTLAEYYRGRIPAAEVEEIQKDCAVRGVPAHGPLMERCGWPAIPYDGKLLITHQDALLLGGKVQAPAGYADHVVLRDAGLCVRCGAKTCIEVCSGQALRRGGDGVPAFDREKCVHCGACVWSCVCPDGAERSNIEFRAGAGGLHSSEN